MRGRAYRSQISMQHAWQTSPSYAQLPFPPFPVFAPLWAKAWLGETSHSEARPQGIRRSKKSFSLLEHPSVSFQASKHRHFHKKSAPPHPGTLLDFWHLWLLWLSEVKETCLETFYNNVWRRLSSSRSLLSVRSLDNLWHVSWICACKFKHEKYHVPLVGIGQNILANMLKPSALVIPWGLLQVTMEHRLQAFANLCNCICGIVIICAICLLLLCRFLIFGDLCIFCYNLCIDFAVRRLSWLPTS